MLDLLAGYGVVEAAVSKAREQGEQLRTSFILFILSTQIQKGVQIFGI